MKNICYYSLSGINYKNQFSSVCAINTSRLVKFNESILPSEIYNHENVKQLRKKLLSGEWPDGCKLCEEIEVNKTGNSMRMDRTFDGEKFSEETNISCYDSLDTNTGYMDYDGCRHIELRFSNACNMSCLHCSPVYSTGWSKRLENYSADDEVHINELEQLTGNFHIDLEEQQTKLKLSVEDTRKICLDLNINFKHIERIEMSGGEVLIQKQFYESLKILSKHPNVDNIIISFYSNFNTDIDFVLLSDLLKPFKFSTITISIDGGQNIYPYFRSGDWNVLTENIRKFREVNNFTELNCVNTFSAYQFMDLENTYQSLIKLDFHHIRTSLVQTPRYINPAMLCFDFYDELMDDFNQTIKIIENEYELRYQNINESLKLRSSEESRFSVAMKDQYRNRKYNSDEWSTKYLFSDLESAKWFLYDIKNYIFNKTMSNYRDYNRFLVYIKKTDNLWGQNFNDYFTKFKYFDNEIVRA